MPSFEDPGTASSESLSYDVATFLREFQQALEWLRKFSPRASEVGRFGQYNRFLTRWYDSRSPEADVSVQEITTAVLDAMELVEIWQQFRSHEVPGLEAKLAEYAKGPVLESDEVTSAGSNSARNIGFELQSLLFFMRAGLAPRIDERADIVMTYEDALVAVECKRPQGEANIDRAVSDGMAQLAARRKQQIGRPFIGVIALSVGKLLHGGDKAIEAGDRHVFDDYCDSELQRLGNLLEPLWLKRKYSKHCQLLLVSLHAPVINQTKRAFISGRATHVFRRQQDTLAKHSRLLRFRKRLIDGLRQGNPRR